MANETWVAVDGHGNERIFPEKPFKAHPNLPLEVKWGRMWEIPCIEGKYNKGTILPKGTIKQWTGKEMIYDSEPVRII